MTEEEKDVYKRQAHPLQVASTDEDLIALIAALDLFDIAGEDDLAMV